jgi:SAM-dependent methyltransferase
MELTDYSARVWADHLLDLRESRLRKVLELFQAERAGRVLDVGCGHGEFGARLLQLGWSVDGVDLEPVQVEAAVSRGLRARVCDLTRGLPFGSDTFDALYAGEVIEHLIDTDAFVAEIARVLKPGGFAILTTPNLASFENRLRAVLGVYPIWVNYRLEGVGHVRAYTPRVLRSQLREHGLIVERHRGNWVPFVPQRFVDDIKWPWLAVTGDWWPGLSMDIIFKARKSNG